MELDLLKKVIAEVLNVDEAEVTLLWMIWEQIHWMYSRLLWVWKRNLILK